MDINIIITTMDFIVIGLSILGIILLPLGVLTVIGYKAVKTIVRAVEKYKD